MDETKRKEAEQIRQDRTAKYGDFAHNMYVLGKSWTALLEQHYQQKLPHDIPPHVVGQMMVDVKQLRAVFKHNDDNLPDMINYAVIAEETAPKEPQVSMSFTIKEIPPEMIQAWQSKMYSFVAEGIPKVGDAFPGDWKPGTLDSLFGTSPAKVKGFQKPHCDAYGHSFVNEYGEQQPPHRVCSVCGRSEADCQ